MQDRSCVPFAWPSAGCAPGTCDAGLGLGLALLDSWRASLEGSKPGHSTAPSNGVSISQNGSHAGTGRNGEKPPLEGAARFFPLLTS